MRCAVRREQPKRFSTSLRVIPDRRARSMVARSSSCSALAKDMKAPDRNLTPPSSISVLTAMGGRS